MKRVLSAITSTSISSRHFNPLTERNCELMNKSAFVLSIVAISLSALTLAFAVMVYLGKKVVYIKSDF